MDTKLDILTLLNQHCDTATREFANGNQSILHSSLSQIKYLLHSCITGVPICFTNNQVYIQSEKCRVTYEKTFSPDLNCIPPPISSPVAHFSQPGELSGRQIFPVNSIPANEHQQSTESYFHERSVVILHMPEIGYTAENRRAYTQDATQALLNVLGIEYSPTSVYRMGASGDSRPVKVVLPTREAVALVLNRMHIVKSHYLFGSLYVRKSLTISERQSDLNYTRGPDCIPAHLPSWWSASAFPVPDNIACQSKKGHAPSFHHTAQTRTFHRTSVKNRFPNSKSFQKGPKKLSHSVPLPRVDSFLRSMEAVTARSMSSVSIRTATEFPLDHETPILSGTPISLPGPITPSHDIHTNLNDASPSATPVRTHNTRATSQRIGHQNVAPRHLK